MNEKKYFLKISKSIRISMLLCLLFITCFFGEVFGIEKVSIYNIQYTSNNGIDGTFPSTYLNQTVRTSGVVVGSGFDQQRFFISELSGGAWSGLCVEQRGLNVSVGDHIELTGKVVENMGLTTLVQVTDLKVIQKGVTLPNPTIISVQEALQNEAYESVLVKIINIKCSQKLSNNSLGRVTDDINSIMIENGFRVNFPSDVFNVGDSFSSITGIVNFSFSRFSIHPRMLSDVKMTSTLSDQSSSWGKIKSLYR